MQWLAIGLGAGLGACLRALLARLNPLHHWIPLGTLSANILGGLLIGAALVVFERVGAGWSPNIRLFVITGFLGGLTTFSTFSAEVFTFLNAGKLFAGLGLIGLHVGLTLMATAIGFYIFKSVL